MSTTIQPTNIYQGAAQALERTADALGDAAREVMDDGVGGQLAAAGENATKAQEHVGKALRSSGETLENVISGTLNALEAVGHAAQAAAIGAVGTAGWVGEKAMAGARIAFLNLAKFCAKAANWMAKAIANPERVKLQVEVLGDPSAKSFSERMFEKAGNEIKLSKDAAGYAWDDYAEAGKAAANTVGNAGYAALHAGAVLGHIGAAAVGVGAAGAIKLSELGVRAARVGVLLAEKGVDGAREGAILAAEVTAKAANALARGDQDTVGISREDIAALEARVVALEQRAA